MCVSVVRPIQMVPLHRISPNRTTDRCALPLDNGTLLFMLHDENGYSAKATPGLTTLTLSESIYQVRMIVRPSICVFSSSFTIRYLNVDTVVNTLQLQTGTIHATR